MGTLEGRIPAYERLSRSCSHSRSASPRGWRRSPPGRAQFPEWFDSELSSPVRGNGPIDRIGDGGAPLKTLLGFGSSQTARSKGTSGLERDNFCRSRKLDETLKNPVYDEYTTLEAKDRALRQQSGYLSQLGQRLKTSRADALALAVPSITQGLEVGPLLRRTVDLATAANEATIKAFDDLEDCAGCPARARTPTRLPPGAMCPGP